MKIRTTAHLLIVAAEFPIYPCRFFGQFTALRSSYQTQRSASGKSSLSEVHGGPQGKFKLQKGRDKSRPTQFDNAGIHGHSLLHASCGEPVPTSRDLPRSVSPE
jgi:hypothetical protein